MKTTVSKPRRITSTVISPPPRDWLVIVGLLLSGVQWTSGQTAPAITKQPSDQSASVGASVRFQPTLTGDGPLLFQWRFNQAELPGTTGATLVLTNVQVLDAGGYQLVARNDFGAVTSRVATLTIDAMFTKITTGEIVTSAGNSRGVAWADYDNDGQTDLFVARGGGWGDTPSQLFRNRGDGTFARVDGPLTGTASSAEAVWADLDNDGHLDLAVGRTAQSNALFRNKGEGTFEALTASSVALEGNDTPWLAWGDFDADGVLDLFAGGGNVTGRIYRGLGNGSFVKLTDIGPAIDPTGCNGTAWVDYDDDGDVDLYIAGQGHDLLYRNDGNGSLTRITTGSLVTEADPTYGFAWGDYDNDGDVDLFTAVAGSGNRLYRNDGGGVFTDVTSAPFSADHAVSQACAWGDYDNDGFLDLFVVNDSFPNGATNFLYHNNGDGTFSKITPGSLVSDAGRGSGCGWADYDNDGFLDLFVAVANNARNLLYRNNGNSSAWLKVKCVGTLSNRAALGAKVRVTTLIQGRPVTQTRHIGADGGRSHNDLVAHFGLADAASVESVTVEWPSGVTQRLDGVAARQTLAVTEPNVRLSSARLAVNPGSDATLTVSADPMPEEYQWQRNGVNLRGQTGSVLTVPSPEAWELGRYSVVLHYANGLNAVVTATAVLERPQPPVITAQPRNQTATEGTTLTFQVNASGSAPFAYQWYRNGIALAGGTEINLRLDNVGSAAGGEYSVQVRNLAGDTTSAKALLLVTGGATPVIITQPRSQSVSLGARITLSAVVRAGSQLTYQWQKDGQAIAGATSASFTITSAKIADAGRYSLVITSPAGSISSQTANVDVDATFTKITGGSVVSGGGDSGAVSWADFNNDGNWDLLVANWGGQNNALYRNTGTGSFSTFTGNVANDGGDSDSGVWADFDNDGDLDLYVANWNPPRDYFYRNNGNGTFARLDGSKPFADDDGLAWSASWADYDNDGHVDLFVSNDSFFSVGRGNYLYHNRGNGTFEKITNGVIATDLTSGFGAAWGDYDNDGYLDLFAAAASSENLLYHNRRDGTFERVLTTPGISMGVAYSGSWGDYDNDGDLDLFVANGFHVNNQLFRNDGHGTFTLMTEGDIANDGGDSTNAAWGDYDNDGHLDLFVTNRTSRQDSNNALYHNNGDGTFTRIVTGSPGNDGGASWAAAWGDYNNDGFLDLAVANGNAITGNTGQSEFLYRNNGNANGWLNVRCIGTASNRAAIGAKVRVQTTVRGRTVWQLREISGGAGFAQNDLRANFGLGDAATADIVRIEWPSGIVQEFRNVPGRQFLTVTEPPALNQIGRGTGGDLDLGVAGGRPFAYHVEASTDLRTWSRLTTLTNLTGTLQLNDPEGVSTPQRFYRLSVP